VLAIHQTVTLHVVPVVVRVRGARDEAGDVLDDERRLVSEQQRERRTLPLVRQLHEHVVLDAKERVRACANKVLVANELQTCE
jgi:hypothetical protein